MNSLDPRTKDSRFWSLVSNNPTHFESNCLLLAVVIASFPLFLLFLVFATCYWKREHQGLKKGIEDRLKHLGSFVNQNKKNGKNTENGRCLDRYRDCIQRFALTTAGFVYFSGFQLGIKPISSPSQGTFNNVWRHFWLSQLGEGLVASSGIEARDAAKQLTSDSPIHLPQLKIMWLKMSIVQKLRNPGLFQGILELALCKWENNPISPLEYQCKLLTCLKKIMLTNRDSDTLSSTESGVFVIHRLGTQAASTYPQSPDQAHSTLFPTS